MSPKAALPLELLVGAGSVLNAGEGVYCGQAEPLQSSG